MVCDHISCYDFPSYWFHRCYPRVPAASQIALYSTLLLSITFNRICKIFLFNSPSKLQTWLLVLELVSLSQHCMLHSDSSNITEVKVKSTCIKTTLKVPFSQM